MFRFAEYCRTMSDRVRREAYTVALAQCVTPASVVLNVDAGLGLASLIACKLGARRCFAIDLSSIVQTVRDTSRENGFVERVVVLQGSSRDLKLPTPADVIVSDLPGTLPVIGTHLSNVLDARQRYLAPGGRMIPETDTLWLAVVAAPKSFDDRHQLWQTTLSGLKWRSMLPIVDNRCYEYQARPEELLCSPAEWARIDYATFTQLGLRGSVKVRIPQAATGHGLLAWYDSTLASGIGYSNAPGAREGDYGQMLFPWPEPVQLGAGDIVDIDLRADRIGAEYIWTWNTRIQRLDGSKGAEYRQSTFLGLPLSPEVLRKRAETFVPSLSMEGQVVLEVLQSMRSEMSIVALAEELFAARPTLFRSVGEAHGFVASVSARYSL